MPIFNINGMNMHVQIFAQSLNASPNANTDIQYVDSEIYFSANNWIVDEGLIDEDEAGAAAAWKNKRVRQFAKDETMATKIKIQVMVGRKKPGASEPIRTKDQEVRIHMVEEQGDALFAERDKEKEKALLKRFAKEGKGVWVPDKWALDGDEDQYMVLSGSAGLPITQLSDLPEYPDLPFYIGNIASWLGREKAEDCDGVLGLLGELESKKEMLPVRYDAKWLIYLHPTMAREIYAGEVEANEQMSDGEQD